MSEQHWDADGQWDGDDMSEPDDATVATVTTLEVVHEPAGLPADISVPLTSDQARELTDTIRKTGEVLYMLLARAHAGKAWSALGYSSFAEYVRSEFDMSRSRAYQVIDQANVIAAIEQAAPDGADLPEISEAAARDLKSLLGEVVPEIEARTADLPPDPAGAVVEEIVETFREKARDAREERALEREEAEMDAAERRGFSDTPPSGQYTPPPPPDFDDDDDDYDPVLIRRNVQAAYNLYSAVTALKTMPPVQDLIDTIPPERRIQINDSLAASVAWLQEFQAAWQSQPWQNGADDTDDDGFDEFDESDSDEM